MKISTNRLSEGGIAKLIVLSSIILILSGFALIDELPAYAEVADATATWQDLPNGNIETAVTDESSVIMPDSMAGKASWYVHPRFRTVLMAASTVYPKGSIVKVTNLANKKSVTVTIKDYGPDPKLHPDRVIDLNKVAFQKIASVRAGIINTKVDLIFLAPAASAKSQ